MAILGASVGALAAAYTAQFGFGLEPCILCLYQRIPYAVAGLLGLLALLLPPGRYPVWAVAGCGAAFAAGAGIAFYHVGVEQHWWMSQASCGGGGGAEPRTVEELRTLLLAKPPKACDEID